MKTEGEKKKKKKTFKYKELMVTREKVGEEWVQ